MAPQIELLVHCDIHRRRRNSVGHDYERASPGFSRGWYVEVGEDRLVPSCDSHGAVAVRLGIKDVTGADVCNAHQGIVRGSFEFVAERGRLRKAVELASGNFVG